MKKLSTIIGLSMLIVTLGMAQSNGGQFSNAGSSVLNNTEINKKNEKTSAGSETSESTYELKHSYVFDNEAVIDTIAGANGTIVGGIVEGGLYKAETAGDYIELPADEIAINTYSAITLEARVKTTMGLNTEGYTVLAYFGNTNGELGADGYFMSLVRAADATSKTSLYCGNADAPWEVEEGTTGPVYDDGLDHHIVSVLTNEELSFYIDGEFVSSVQLSIETNKISNIGTSYAWLCKGGYEGNPTWLGSIYEFNIYDGALTSEEVAEKYGEETTGNVSDKIEGVDNMFLSFYPNPANGYANTTINLAKSEVGEYTVYSVTGQVVDSKRSIEFEQGENNLKINTEYLKTGVYIVKVNCGGMQFNGKLNVL